MHASGDHQLALHVIDLLADGDSDSEAVGRARRLKRTILLALADACEVYQSENFYRGAAAQLN